MKLTEREAEVLDFLSERKASAKEVAQALKMKKSNLSTYLKELEEFQLVKAKRKGRCKELSLDDRIAFGISVIKNVFPGVKLSEVLTGKTPYLLANIRSKGDFRIRELDLPAISAKRILARLRRAGFVSMRKRGVYHLRNEAEMVSEFCRQTLMDAHNTEAERELGLVTQAVYSFDSTRELGTLFAVKNEVSPKHYWPTAYTIAHKFGLQIIQAGKWYYTNSKPDLEDVIIHILALGRDARSIMYAAALVLKNKRNPRLLLKKRQTFGLGKEFLLRFVEFLETKGAKPFGGLGFGEIGVMLDETV
ncbi:MAG: ArsR family transcriptional regulator [Candidatus Altiarchaeota archaeon]